MIDRISSANVQSMLEGARSLPDKQQRQIEIEVSAVACSPPDFTHSSRRL